VRLADEPRELVKDLARPLVSTAARESEPVRDLNAEICWAKLEAIATVPLSIL
jgi:hypothetical protein